MTAPVDVLAVMDDLAERYIANRGTTSQFITCVTPGVHGDDNALRGSAVGAAWLDLIEARAAVAELIEAAKEMRANFRCVLEVNCNCDEEFIARQTENVDAALARVGGA